MAEIVGVGGGRSVDAEERSDALDGGLLTDDQLKRIGAKKSLHFFQEKKQALQCSHPLVTDLRRLPPPRPCRARFPALRFA